MKAGSATNLLSSRIQSGRPLPRRSCDSHGDLGSEAVGCRPESQFLPSTSSYCSIRGFRDSRRTYISDNPQCGDLGRLDACHFQAGRGRRVLLRRKHRLLPRTPVHKRGPRLPRQRPGPDLTCMARGRARGKPGVLCEAPLRGTHFKRVVKRRKRLARGRRKRSTSCGRLFNLLMVTIAELEERLLCVVPGGIEASLRKRGKDRLIGSLTRPGRPVEGGTATPIMAKR